MILTANRASRRCAACISGGAILDVLWIMLPVGKVDSKFNGPDDSADGPERLDIEDRCLEFFIFVSICSILLNRCFPDTNKG